MSAPARPPFRADHVGSLLRPSSLKTLRDDVAAGRASTAQLCAAEDAAIRGVVALQESAGLQTVTDGELRRKSWHMDFLTRSVASTARARRCRSRSTARPGP